MFYALSQQVYAQGQKAPEGGPQAGGSDGTQSNGPQTPPPGGDGDVIDGEVREA